jgi:hypothetical protein
MNRKTVLLAAALLLPGCDDKPKEDGQAKKTEETDHKDQPAQKADEAQKAEPPADPWKEKLESRVLADSGLGVGGKLAAFQILNCESGEEYCQVCRFGGSPKVMAIGTSDDEAFKKDLKDLDAIAQKYDAQGLKAFAVVTDLAEGKATTPSDPSAAQAKAKALKEELGISIPVVVPAPAQGGPNKVWDEYYNITASRTVMFADGRNEVKWSAVGPSDWSQLNEAIVSTIGS